MVHKGAALSFAMLSGAGGEVFFKYSVLGDKAAVGTKATEAEWDRNRCETNHKP